MKDKLKKLIQYASDFHLERGFKRGITPKTPNLILGGPETLLPMPSL